MSLKVYKGKKPDEKEKSILEFEGNSRRVSYGCDIGQGLDPLVYFHQLNKEGETPEEIRRFGGDDLEEKGFYVGDLLDGGKGEEVRVQDGDLSKLGGDGSLKDGGFYVGDLLGNEGESLLENGFRRVAIEGLAEEIEYELSEDESYRILDGDIDFPFKVLPQQDNVNLERRVIGREVRSVDYSHRNNSSRGLEGNILGGVLDYGRRRDAVYGSSRNWWPFSNGYGGPELEKLRYYGGPRRFRY